MKYINLTLLMLIILLCLQPVERAAADGEVPHQEVQEIETVYTDYQITLKKAVDIQLNTGANPITDIYRDDPAYIHINDFEILNPKISVPEANIRTAPSTMSEIAFKFPKDVSLHIVGLERGMDSVHSQIVYVNQKELPIRTVKVKKSLQNNDLWYKIAYKTKTYFAHTSVVTANQIKTTKNTKVHQGPTNNYHVFGELEKDETLTIAELGVEWFQVNYKNWRTPKPKDIRRLLNPNREHQNMFQHIRLDETLGVPATELDKVLENKGILEGLGEAFIAAGEEHGINEAYLIAHALLESGFGTSELATGVEVGMNEKDEPTIVTESNRESLKKVKTAYNMFGIGAADSCPLECGAKTAYESEWFTPETAVKDGAAWIGEGYIYNEFEQNTLYKMKWNPKMSEGQHWKQYATDIGWAEKQTARIQEIYEQLTNPKYFYDIPTYLEK